VIARIGECNQRPHRNGYECMEKGQHEVDYKGEGGSLVAERQSYCSVRTVEREDWGFYMKWVNSLNASFYYCKNGWESV